MAILQSYEYLDFYKVNAHYVAQEKKHFKSSTWLITFNSLSSHVVCLQLMYSIKVLLQESFRTLYAFLLHS